MIGVLRNPFFMETRPIPSVIGYAASACGQIISFHRLEPFALRQANHPQGYKKVCVKTYAGIKNRLVHRLVMEAWVGPCPEGCVTNHKNGNKTDNRLENLEYCTQSENMAHSYGYGLSPKPPTKQGSDCRLSKLNEEKVLALRAETDRKPGHLQRLSDKYGITASSISKILLRRTWKHI
jgi:hypothetical protein